MCMKFFDFFTLYMSFGCRLFYYDEKCVRELFVRLGFNRFELKIDVWFSSIVKMIWMIMVGYIL